MSFKIGDRVVYKGTGNPNIDYSFVGKLGRVVEARDGGPYALGFSRDFERDVWPVVEEELAWP